MHKYASYPQKSPPEAADAVPAVGRWRLPNQGTQEVVGDCFQPEIRGVWAEAMLGDGVYPYTLFELLDVVLAGTAMVIEVPCRFGIPVSVGDDGLVFPSVLLEQA